MYMEGRVWCVWDELMLPARPISRAGSIKEFFTFYQTEGSLPCLQNLVTGTYLEMFPVCAFSPCFIKTHFNIILPCTCLPSGIFLGIFD
jgi:hypothetical protein